jgi:methoxymalonate biosynthesis acyl carrier protein
MTADHSPVQTRVTSDEIEGDLLRFLAQKTRATVARDQDIFGSGLVTSMFALELVVYLEKSYDVEITGQDLKLDNFRSVRSMTGLVLRLRDASGAADDA